MALALYELAAADGTLYSPNCWRSAMALAHKGLDWERRPIGFTGIEQACSGHKAVPVLDDDGTLVGDSWRIAEHLEERYPSRPTLFGCETGKRLAWFVQQWTQTQINPLVFRMIALDIHDRLTPDDQAYFRRTREPRLGGTLEEAHARRDTLLPALRAALAPLRLTLGTQPFLGGDAPTYADYIVFGTLQWSRTCSALQLLEADDPVLGWFDRCLELHGGLGRSTPGR